MLEFDASGIGLFLKEKINRYTYEPKIYEYGTVASCADGIVQVSGLSHSRYGELWNLRTIPTAWRWTCGWTG